MNQVQAIPLGYDLNKILTELARVRDYYAQFPFVRRTALHISSLSQNNDLDRILARLTEFVRSRVIYVPDPHGFEFVTAPDVMLAEILAKGRAHGDCDDHVLLLNTLLCSVGFETAFVGVKQGGDEFNHVITSVFHHGRWQDIDPCDKSGIGASYDEKFVVI